MGDVSYLRLEWEEANTFFQLISRRYDRGLMIITSNQSFYECGTVLGDDMLIILNLDRVLDHCEVPPINGTSYRLRDRMDSIPGAIMAS